MREIKFRGKRIDNGEWVYGGFLTESAASLGIDVPLAIARICWVIVRLGEFYHVDPETVGQFTGLKDKNGKDIYADDVVQAAHGKCLVKWNENRSAFMLYDLTDELYMMNMEPYLARHVAVYGVEVLGNIHESQDEVSGKKPCTSK